MADATSDFQIKKYMYWEVFSFALMLIYLVS